MSLTNPDRESRPRAPLLWLLVSWAACLLGPRATRAEPLPASLPASPPAARPGLRLRPYTAFTWDWAGRLKHLVPMIWTPKNPPGVAARSSVRQPEGCRVLLDFHASGLLGQPEDRCRDEFGRLTPVAGVWADHGIEAVAKAWEAFLTSFQAAGGKCDLVVMDYEEGWSIWVMPPQRRAAIARDPRFPAVARRLGFSDLNQALPDPDREGFLTWGNVMGSRLAEAINQALGKPLGRHFPAAGLCNFGGAVLTRPNAMPDPNGHLYCYDVAPGNCQAPALYGNVGLIAVRGLPGNWQSPFTALLWSADTVRASARSSSLPVLPWVAFRSYAGDGPGAAGVPWARTDWWQENVYHALLSSASTNVLYWNPTALKNGPTNAAARNLTTPADNQALEDALGELEGQARGRPLATPLRVEFVPYDARVLVSAARTDDGTIVARVSFADGVQQAEVELGGKKYPVARPAGKVGAWLVVPR